ncbi:MAG: hypothetical protein M1834_005217 [Cirrosporium novae-zelandiae]|nr:MAG: hypothetical protein M1834_005217 [Cirrosporium novae-zelandiae]
MAATEAQNQNFNTMEDTKNSDPFATHRTDDNNPFSSDDGKNLRDLSSSPPSAGKRDRRLSKEWDASKVPPSRFQKRAGSIYSTPGSRDGHVGRKDQEYHEKLKEKVYKPWLDKITKSSNPPLTITTDGSPKLELRTLYDFLSNKDLIPESVWLLEYVPEFVVYQINTDTTLSLVFY